jgi:pimeloyl-ACP methyl ester carboxylesterase
MHATAAIALDKTGFSAFSLFTTGLILVIFLFKVFAICKPKHLLGLHMARRRSRHRKCRKDRSLHKREILVKKRKEGKHMSTLTVPGAQLSYEVSGSGPLLILIPGASGVGEVFRQVARELSARYQVVTYDRRGFSRSQLDGPQDYDHRLSTDADDVRRLIEHLTNQPTTIFGNSSGAIVALEVLTQYPERVQTVVAHEPPVVLLLPDAAKWLAFFDGVYDSYRKDGVPKAMRQFASGIVGSVDYQVIERSMAKHASEYTMANAVYWMEHELRQYPRVELDLDALAAHASQLVPACGRDSQDQMTSQPNKILARQLGLNLVELPGGHLGFMASPAEFAKELMDSLSR